MGIFALNSFHVKKCPKNKQTKKLYLVKYIYIERNTIQPCLTSCCSETPCLRARPSPKPTHYPAPPHPVTAFPTLLQHSTLLYSFLSPEDKLPHLPVGAPQDRANNQEEQTAVTVKWSQLCSVQKGKQHKEMFLDSQSVIPHFFYAEQDNFWYCSHHKLWHKA